MPGQFGFVFELREYASSIFSYKHSISLLKAEQSVQIISLNTNIPLFWFNCSYTSASVVYRLQTTKGSEVIVTLYSTYV